MYITLLFRFSYNKEVLLDCDSLIGSKIERVTRKAKYILLYLHTGQILILHLGMTGKILFSPKWEPLAHNHLKLWFEDDYKLIFNDARRFGTIKLVSVSSLDNDISFRHLGIEPLEDSFDFKALKKLCASRKAPIKSLLMNAKLIVGVGNIYASESLFRAKVLPIRGAGSLNDNEIQLLTISIKKVLNDAINSGGSTLRDYTKSDGGKGGFQHHFSVYGKAGKPCNICESSIEKIVISKRSTFYCPECQK